MDIRKEFIETQEKLIESNLNSKDFYLEIAKSLETLADLQEIIKGNAALKFRIDSSKHRLLFFSFRPLEIEEFPKFLFLAPLSIWFMLFLFKKVSKISFFYVVIPLRAISNYRRDYYCKKVPEYQDYKQIGNNVENIINLKIKSMSLQRKLEIFLFDKFENLI